MLEMNAVFNIDYPTRQASSYQDRKLRERVTSSVQYHWISCDCDICPFLDTLDIIRSSKLETWRLHNVCSDLSETTRTTSLLPWAVPYHGLQMLLPQKPKASHMLFIGRMAWGGGAKPNFIMEAVTRESSPIKLSTTLLLIYVQFYRCCTFVSQWNPNIWLQPDVVKVFLRL